MEQSGDHNRLSASEGFAAIAPASTHSKDESCSSDLNSRKKLEGGLTFVLILTGSCATLGSCVPAGYSIGVINTPAEIINKFCNETIINRYDIALSDTALGVLWSTIVSIFLIGGVIGSLSGAYVADKIGRKGAVVVINSLSIIAAILFIFSKHVPSVELLLLGRFIIGLSAGLATSIIPMYLTEISPLYLRGAMGVLCPLGICLGVLFAQIMGLKQLLGQEDSWQFLLAFYIILVIICSVLIPFLPESPKYLYIIKNQPLHATKELSRLRNMRPDQLQHELDSLRAAQRLEQDVTEDWNIKKVIRDPSLRLPLMLVCALQGGQQCSGINAVFYYSISIFKSAGLSDEESQYANIGAGIINFIMSVLAIPLMSRFGRRTLSQLSCYSSAVCLLLLMFSINYIESLSWMPYFCILTVLAFVFCYGFGLGPIPYFIGSELFDVGPRPAAMALGSMSNWGGNFLIGMTFPTLQSFIKAYSFVPFAFVCLCLGLLLRIYLPETKGRDPAEIAELCSKGFHPVEKPLMGSTSRNEKTGDITHL